jgi:tetratricopeptide (TPR) repeat protein
MQKRSRPFITAVFALGLMLAPLAAYGAGGQKKPGSSDGSSTQLTPKQMAGNAYNAGITYIKKADELEAEALVETNEKKRAKLEGKSRKAYEKAIRANQEAIGYLPEIFEAHSNLGYAYRKTGAYEEGLAAYDKALELEPRYTPAIEYRAEAYLALDRVSEAKEAYMTLFRSDRPRAQELGEAMVAWVKSRRSDAAGIPAEKIEEFADWLAQREEIATQTTFLAEPSSGW